MSDTSVTRGGWAPTGTAAERRATVSATPGTKALRTRRRLLDAARSVFARHGYLDATVELIVAEAGVARGSFYTYFESKTDVFRHLAATIDELVGERVVGFERADENDVLANLERSTRNYLELVRDHADLYRLVDHVVVFDEVVRVARISSRLGHIRRVAGTIRRWQERGWSDPGVDPDTTAAALVSMLSSSAHWMYVMGDGTDVEQSGASLTAAWARTVGLRSVQTVASGSHSTS
jgi:AcrR family transcriptional regulator